MRTRHAPTLQQQRPITTFYISDWHQAQRKGGGVVGVSCRRSSLKRRAGTSRSSFSEQTSARFWVFSETSFRNPTSEEEEIITADDLFLRIKTGRLSLFLFLPSVSRSNPRRHREAASQPKMPPQEVPEPIKMRILVKSLSAADSADPLTAAVPGCCAFC